jgi:excisionase family DNA binding protein
MKKKSEGALGLLRLSEVAEMVGMHPKTVYHWVRSGRLSAVASPGGMLRVRAEDARALCHKSGIPVPEQIATVARKVAIVSSDKTSSKALTRSLKGKGFEVVSYSDPYEAFVAVVKDPPEVLVVGVAIAGIEVVRMVAALQGDERTKKTRVYGWGDVPVESKALFSGSAPAGDASKMSNEIK